MLKETLTIFLVVGLSFLSFSQQAESVEFNTPEERIVFNKKNGLDRYEGIAIEYTYEMVNGNVLDSTEIRTISESYFTEILGIDTYEVNGSMYVSFLTKGKQANNDGSILIRDEKYKKLKFTQRTYHLTQP